jgi:hypothetical protein
MLHGFYRKFRQSDSFQKKRTMAPRYETLRSLRMDQLCCNSIANSFVKIPKYPPIVVLQETIMVSIHYQSFHLPK